MSDIKLIKEIILERNPRSIFLENKFDKALIGTSIQCGRKQVATYDSNKCIEILIEELDFNELEAYEHFSFTTEQIESNENAPIIFSDFSNAKSPNAPEINEHFTLEDIL